ncbi:MAG: hypothetical protein QOG45_2033 [Chloroflexota bacterium]|nr:hypothetical protein [Chloroflexota bacterium]
MPGETTDERAAWGVACHREPRWPASLAALAALLLYLTLPAKLTIGPAWLIPAGEAALLLFLTLTSPDREREEERVGRLLSIAVIVVINAANVVSLVRLIDALVTGGAADGRSLIIYSVQIWMTNVIVFALWYWELDRGGPGERTHHQHREPDFLFPQMVTPEAAPSGWSPTFLDYLYVAFTNATAFSPTDTMPLTVMAKMLMAVQSLASLLTVAVVAARAVNILGGK